MYLRSETLGSLHKVRCDLKSQFAGKRAMRSKRSPSSRSVSSGGGRWKDVGLPDPPARLQDLGLPAGGKVGIEALTVKCGAAHPAPWTA